MGAFRRAMIVLSIGLMEAWASRREHMLNSTQMEIEFESIQSLVRFFHSRVLEHAARGD